MKRDIVTIDDLSNENIEEIFTLADQFLEKMADPTKPYRIKGRETLANDVILASLFFEPSTRTRFSFEAAIQRLGGGVLSSPAPGTTSAAKGESIADTVRVIENYADLIVIRHPFEGAARVAADYASVPVINAGDGSHEHPTQTLCDLYTLRREKKTLEGLTVLLWGDLKNGRTIHSLVYALARFGASIIPMPAEGLQLPEHVQRRLERDFQYIPLNRKEFGEIPGDEFPVDVVYVTPDRSDRLSLFPELEEMEVRVKLTKKAFSHIDVCYVTRFQKERLKELKGDEHYPVVDAAFLDEKRYKNSRVLHPLPRVAELGYDIDDDPRGIYFKQAAYGVPVRMALISWLLGLKPGLTSKNSLEGRFETYSHRQGLGCSNARCVTHLESEKRYLVPKFWIVEDSPVILRCVYCEYELQPRCVANFARNKYGSWERWKKLKPQDLVFFSTQAEAERAGFEPYKERDIAETEKEPTISV